MAEKLKFIIDALLMSYARIFFSESKILGAFVFTATMIVPFIGMSAFACGLLSSLCALMLGMDRDSVSKGVYGLNGILVGGWIGYYFAPSPAMAVLLVLTALFLTAITVLLNSLLYQMAALPAMSMPFTLITWLLVGASGSLNALVHHRDHLQIIVIPTGLLPYWLETFLSALGAVLYMPDQFVGLIVALGLILWSRIALLLLFIGFATSSIMMQQLGIDSSAVAGNSLIFNHMFAALAIGGIFTVPGPGSLLFAVLAAASSLLILVGCTAFLPQDFSALALPFNIAVMVTLYLLRSRLHPSFDLRLAPTPPGSPEENISHFRENLRVWRRWGVALSLPYRGKWKVSQGVDGSETHQGDWRFAYDFQAVAADGSIFANSGLTCEDYYSWGAPIYSPAAGTVHIVIDGVPDNSIGAINGVNNWGNCVIIAHAENYFSCMAHFQNGSISVKPGELVARGTEIGRCGNSGRSPLPHLHFQMQMSPYLGAPCMQFSFENFSLIRKGHECFVSKSDVLLGDVLEPAEPCLEYERYFPYSIGGGWTFRFKKGKDESREMWEAGIDFYGNTYIVSYPQQTRLYFVLKDGVLTFKKLEGCRDSGLFLLGRMIVDVPFLAVGAVTWTTEETADYVLWPFLSRMLDVFSLVGVSVRQKIEGSIVGNYDEVHVRTVSHLMLETPLGSVCMTPPSKGEMLFSRYKGLVFAKLKAIELYQA
ncbi:MAG: urea transporter [Chlorobiales bacterium]|nr:urea transporter [Chlorobiales bacterium]